MALEKQKLGYEELDLCIPETRFRTFFTMQETSRTYMEHIQKIFRNSLASFAESTFPSMENTGCAVFFFGSPKQFSALPLSDADIVVFNTPDLLDVRKVFESQVANLPFVDHNDIPSDWSGIEHLYPYAYADDSPEAEYAFLLPIDGDPTVIDEYNRSPILRHFLERQNRGSKILFSRPYLDQQYADKSTREGDNLKYSKGASRDLIFFSWFYEYMYGLEGEMFFRSSSVPKILLGLRSLAITEDLSSSQVDEALQAIDIINFVKYRTLELLEQEYLAELEKGNLEVKKGKGYMNEKTARLLLQDAYKEFSQLGVETWEDLQRLYSRSKTIVASLRTTIEQRVLHNHKVEKDKNGDPEWGSRYKHAIQKRVKTDRDIEIYRTSDKILKLGYIWSAREINDVHFLKKVGELEQDTNSFAIACSLISSGMIKHSTTAHFCRYLASKKGYEYLFREVVRSRGSVCQQTLHWMLNSGVRLALNPDIHERYKLEVQKRLEMG